MGGRKKEYVVKWTHFQVLIFKNEHSTFYMWNQR